MSNKIDFERIIVVKSPAGALLLCFEKGRGKTLTYEITL